MGNQARDRHTIFERAKIDRITTGRGEFDELDMDAPTL